MKLKLVFVIAIFQSLPGMLIYGQDDQDPPVSPLLNLVTINHPQGTVQLSWSLSPSPDVTGYVVYAFEDNAGFDPDTIYNPNTSTYIRGLASPYFSESYVVAALDSSGNISPLSNDLHTIFTTAVIDTCNNKIEVKWNSYSSYPFKVISYSIRASTDGINFTERGMVNPDKTNFIISTFSTDTKYCFRVIANLEGGYKSTSNNSCILTSMQRPPGWINADYATVSSDNEISLSFTIDPSSEITQFLLEKKDLTTGNFKEIAKPQSVNMRVLYTDKQADVNKINYYRLSAINTCNKSVITSNMASNLLINLERNENNINLFWDAYTLWQGAVSSYTLFINTGNGFEIKAVLPPADTLFTIDYSSIMYNLTESEVCFLLIATETNNPHGITGITSSSDVCTYSIENVTVPNVFTPNNDLVNDLFKPVLSFTPKDYHLTISNINGNILFETNDFKQEWDGYSKGNLQPEGVYLWYLKVTTPAGKGISQKGTLTIISN